MNNVLAKIVNDFIGIMKIEDGVLGAWNFGSGSRGMSDEYSDADIVFLVDGKNFAETVKGLKADISKVCDKVLICWEEGFNGEAIINNGYLIQKDGKIFQFDVFLLNNDRIKDYICQIHYMCLTEKDILFDKNGKVGELCGNCPCGSLWQGDTEELFKTYLYHFYMTAKYIIRKDYFKLNYVMRTLFDTHASVLLTSYDRINWGGEGNKLGFIPEEKQEHLKRYFCCGDFEVNRSNLLRAFGFFKEDIMEAAEKNEVGIDLESLDLVKKHYVELCKISYNCPSK